MSSALLAFLGGAAEESNQIFAEARDKQNRIDLMNAELEAKANFQNRLTNKNKREKAEKEAREKINFLTKVFDFTQEEAAHTVAQGKDYYDKTLAWGNKAIEQGVSPSSIYKNSYSIADSQATIDSIQKLSETTVDPEGLFTGDVHAGISFDEDSANLSFVPQFAFNRMELDKEFISNIVKDVDAPETDLKKIFNISEATLNNPELLKEYAETNDMSVEEATEKLKKESKAAVESLKNFETGTMVDKGDDFDIDKQYEEIVFLLNSPRLLQKRAIDEGKSVEEYTTMMETKRNNFAKAIIERNKLNQNIGGISTDPLHNTFTGSYPLKVLKQELNIQDFVVVEDRDTGEFSFNKEFSANLFGAGTAYMLAARRILDGGKIQDDPRTMVDESILRDEKGKIVLDENGIPKKVNAVEFSPLGMATVNSYMDRARDFFVKDAMRNFENILVDNDRNYRVERADQTDVDEAKLTNIYGRYLGSNTYGHSIGYIKDLHPVDFDKRKDEIITTFSSSTTTTGGEANYTQKNWKEAFEFIQNRYKINSEAYQEGSTIVYLDEALGTYNGFYYNGIEVRDQNNKLVLEFGVNIIAVPLYNQPVIRTTE